MQVKALTQSTERNRRKASGEQDIWQGRDNHNRIKRMICDSDGMDSMK